MCRRFPVRAESKYTFSHVRSRISGIMVGQASETVHRKITGKMPVPPIEPGEAAVVEWKPRATGIRDHIYEKEY